MVYPLGLEMDQIGRLDVHSWEKKENPQTYMLLPSYGENPKPSQHILGVVGGNEVPYKNRQLQVEVESDLRGITRPNTFCPDRQHKPLPPNVKEISRVVPKQNVKVNVVTQPLKQSQMWAYPATVAPESFTIETCARPEKY
jgi:hypothetical protein